MPEINKSALAKKLSKWITPRSLSWLLLTAYLITLIPMLWIGQYNYPSADDYSIGSNARQAWAGSHSLVETLYEAILRVVDDWHTWMGYFTADLFMTLPPSIFGERYYALTTAIIVTALSLSTCYFLQQLLVKVFHAHRDVSRSIGLIFMMVMIQCMKGRTEVLFWYNGSANYMLTYAVAMWYYGLLISLGTAQKEKRLSFFFLITPIGFLTGGANLMTGLNTAILLTLTVGWIAYQKGWKENKRILYAIAIFFVGFLLNIAAPGNRARAEVAGGMGAVEAIFSSFAYCLEYCVGEWTDGTVVLMLVFLLPLFWVALRNTDFSFPYPVLVIFLGFCLASAMVTPPLFGVGSMQAGRLQGLTYARYLLLLMLSEGYLVGWFKNKYGSCSVGEKMREKSRAEEETEGENGFSIRVIAAIMVSAGTLIALSLFTAATSPYYYTSTAAIKDMRNGSAKAYGEALARRADLYNSGEKNILVDPLPAHPNLLFFSDITTDAQDWKNRGLCRYYGLESVRIKE